LPHPAASEQSAAVFTESISNAGAYIMGSRTFVAAGENPPFQKPTFVLSHEQRPPIARDGTTITFIADGIESALNQARASAEDKAVYVFGGANVAQQFLKAGLIDELQINFIPVLLGDGIRLFDNLDGASTKLEATSVVEAAGVTHLRYRVVR
jgi:dihydrofolate reductase